MTANSARMYRFWSNVLITPLYWDIDTGNNRPR